MEGRTKHEHLGLWYYINTCAKCGIEFRALKEDSQYCKEHKGLGRKSRAKSTRVRKTMEEVKALRNQKKKEKRRAKGVLPREIRYPKPEPAPKERMVISTVINESRPPAPETGKKKRPMPVAYFFLQVNAKTRYGFTDMTRLNKFKRNHKDLFL